jgi:hypothetical protein
MMRSKVARESTPLLTEQPLIGRVPDRDKHRDNVIVWHVEKLAPAFRVEADHWQGGQAHSVCGRYVQYINRTHPRTRWDSRYKSSLIHASTWQTAIAP